MVNESSKPSKFIAQILYKNRPNVNLTKITFYNKLHNHYIDMEKSKTSSILLTTKTINPDEESEIYKETDNETDIYQRCRKKAMDALNNNKIFTIYGKGPTVRRALLRKGWIEKCCETHLPELQELTQDELIKNYKSGNDYETVLLTKILEDYPATLIWQNMKLEPKKLLELNPKYQNRIHRSKLLNFTTKEGLIGCIENSYWTACCCNFEIRSPRFHRLSAPEEKSEFIHDFEITYCLSLLKFISENDKPESLFDEFGTLSIDIVKKSIKIIQSELYPQRKNNKNKSINKNYNSKESRKFFIDWKNFYLPVKMFIDGEEKIEKNKNYEIRKLITECHKLIEKANNHWPDLWIDGYNNLWILKPASYSQGIGIVIKNNLDEIFSYALRYVEKRYIVQKYIERPLLIYNTKFDIRQYTLVTITDSSIFIWMYKDCCYLRFSSQEYQLSTLTESVHLTNNSVQKKYKNGSRSPKLPEHNMWTLDEFKNYVKETGKNINELWTNQIYENMKKNFVAVVLASLIDIDIIPGSFEFFGCDFMLDENYEPILIEINAVPDMRPSTIVTEKICPKVLEDVINVITELPITRTPTQGQFEIIYSINYQNINKTDKFKDLQIEGVGIIKKIPNISKTKNTIRTNVKINITEIKVATSKSQQSNSKKVINKKRR